MSGLDRPQETQLELLQGQVRLVHEAWRLYGMLFLGDKQRVERQNRLSGVFFWWVQRSLRDQVILGITRLLESPGEGRNSKLVLESVVGLPSPHSGLSIAPSLKDRVEAIRREATGLKRFRNKRVAHMDHRIAVFGWPGQCAPHADSDKIGGVLRLIAEFMNAVEVAVGRHPCEYDEPAVNDDSADILVAVKNALVGGRLSSEYQRLYRELWGDLSSGD